jgi:transglutaminase-like putative cysteine protease
LHAWAEVYLPGGGWRGYDPTLGLAVADHHVAVAAGMRPGLAAPITGIFRGTGVASHMQADIRIRVSGKALP